MAKQAEYSPMMQNYLQTKQQYNDCILLYRLGDFYEMFFEDAEEASRILDLTLTGKNCGMAERAPMCGVPFHAVDVYVARLLQAGKKVAICEQLTEPGGKELVKRDVVRVITPGTVMDSEILEDSKSNYLCALYFNDKMGVAFCDISTGEFVTTELLPTAVGWLHAQVFPLRRGPLQSKTRQRKIVPSVPRGNVGRLRTWRQNSCRDRMRRIARLHVGHAKA